MLWVEVFVLFAISHLLGDFILQTNWQATHKTGGLGRNPEARPALVSHIATYTLAFVPALVWIGIDVSIGWAIAGAALVAIPHMVQDDGRLLDAFMRDYKGIGDDPPAGLRLAIDQSTHLIMLFGAALLIGS